MGLLELLRGKSRAAKAEHSRAVSTTLRADCERALSDEPLSPDEAHEMYLRHEALGISPERFVELVEVLRSARVTEELIGGDEWSAETARLADELAAAQEEYAMIENRKRDLKGLVNGLSGNLTSRRESRNAHKAELARIRAENPELFAETGK